MKKGFKYLSIIAMLMGLAGCGNTPADSSSNSQNSEATSNNSSENVSNSSSDTNSGLTFDTNKTVSITFHHTMNGTLAGVLDEAIIRFRKIYPNIYVDHNSIGGYDDVRDQMSTILGANPDKMPDMVYCYPDHVALYNQANHVVVLDKYIYDPVYGLTDEEIDNFIPSYWNEGKEFGDNQMYSLPFSKSSEVMYYDKDFFAEHNLQVPDHWFATTTNLADDPTSLEYVCDQIVKIDPLSYPLGYDSEANWFITMCEQLGSGYTSTGSNHYIFDNPTNRDFVKKLKVWYDKQYFTTKSIYGQYTSNLFKNQVSTEARCYMSIGSSAGASNQVPDGFEFEVGVAPIPQMDPANGKVISQGPNVALFKSGDNQKMMASWLLLKFLTTDIAFQGNFSINSGYSPVIKSVYSNAAYVEFLDNADGYNNITALSTTVARDQENWYFTSPAFVGSSNARDQVGNLMSNVFTNNSSDIDKTIDAAFKNAINELNS